VFSFRFVAVWRSPCTNYFGMDGGISVQVGVAHHTVSGWTMFLGLVVGRYHVHLPFLVWMVIF
jgi:hypothetical protein